MLFMVERDRNFVRLDAPCRYNSVFSLRELLPVKRGDIVLLIDERTTRKGIAGMALSIAWFFATPSGIAYEHVFVSVGEALSEAKSRAFRHLSRLPRRTARSTS